MYLASVAASAQYQNKVHGQPDDINRVVGMGIQPCTAAGDVYYVLNATGSGTLDIYMNYEGVQLR